VRGAFNHIYVQRLLDRDATRENIRATRAKLMESDPDDVVVVFIAGHGVPLSTAQSKGDYHLITADCTLGTLKERAMPYAELDTLLDGIPSRRKLLLVDSCHSGEGEMDPNEIAPDPTAIDPNARAVVNVGAAGVTVTPVRRKMHDTFTDLRQQSGAFVVAAAEAQQLAGEGEGVENGTFTYVALEGLTTGGADTDKDHQIRVSELVRYVTVGVATRTKKRQIPTTRFENGSNDFVFCRTK
jgi:hypothetical protein